MRVFFTLLFFSLCLSQQTFAVPPTVPSSNLTFSGIQGGRFSLSFTAGNGSNRIIVVKAGSPVTGLPVDGTLYNFNGTLGTAGTAFTGPDEYVVYRGTSTTASVSGLQPSTTYFVSIFEFNGTGAGIEYLTIPHSGSVTTASAPTVQAHSLAFSNITGNSLRLDWTKGNGSSRLVLARKGAPVNVVPTDLTEYSASGELGAAAVLNGDNYVVYRNTGNLVNVTKMEPNTTYHFAIFEFNGGNTPVYLSPAATASVTTLAGPTLPATSISQSSKEGNRFTLSISGGNGGRRLIVMRKDAAVTSIPVNGMNYIANAAFGSGEEMNSGEFVVSNTNNLVTVTNLEPSSTYFVRVFEFDIDAASNTYYLTSASASGSFSTQSPPTIQVSGINFQNVNGSSMSVKFTAGNGSYRTLIMKEGAPVDAEPTELIKHNGNGSFGLGTELGTGNYVINGGVNGTTINVVNLTPGKTYHLAMFEYNGNNYPVYARPAATASIFIPNQPTTAASNFSATIVEGNSLRANWTNGNGSRRIVIAKKASPVTATPVDGTSYTADPDFGEGTEILPGEFVVYDGINTIADLRNLEINTSYHIAVFEYNTGATGPDYLASSYLAGNAATASAPSVQASALSASGVQSDRATFSFTAGNGAGRIILIREGSPVNADPSDLVTYSSNTIFGSGAQIGTGNYIVYRSTSTSTLTVTGLQSNTEYHLAVYEYNGSGSPVYLKPAHTYSFTTLPAAGDITPTLPATNPVFSMIDGNKLRLSWTNGNGAGRIVVARQGAAVTANPANGGSYTANASFGSGSELTTGEFVVYAGGSSVVTVSNLLPGQEYHFSIIEYNGSGATTSYLSLQPLAANMNTATAPTVGVSNVSNTVTPGGLKIDWTNGNGNGRLVVLREDNAVTSMPADLSAYPGNAAFGSGSQVGAGQYVVYSGTGNTVTVTGLTTNKTYHYSIFEYNGIDAPVYDLVNAVSGSALINETLPVKWAYFTARQEAGVVKLKWGTLQEENSAYFIVERNTGTGYEMLDTILSAGNSSIPADYSYTDASCQGGQATYRIRQVDIDGRSTYSQVVLIQFTNDDALFSIFPNPASGQFTVKLKSNRPAIISLVDVKGTTYRKLQVLNNQQIGIGHLPAGIYYVILEQDGVRNTRQLIKR